MSSSARRWGLWIALLAVLGGLVWNDQRAESTASLVSAVGAAARTDRTSVVAAAAASAPVTLPRLLVPRAALVPRRPAASTVDLFAAHSWAPPPVAAPPPRAMPVPPPPAGPALSYLGKRQDEQGWQVYLGRGDQTLIVREGDTVEGSYRVESIRPPTLTLSRGDQRHQIGIGDWE